MSIKYSAASADYKRIAPDLALEHILAMAQWGGVDIIEISGGDYEKPGKIKKNARNNKRHFYSFFQIS